MMLDVARHAESGKPVSLAAISERIGVSRGYLEQLALSLRNARLIRSVSGRHGGYQLALPASEILVGDIIEATIGPICIVECVDDPDLCIRSSDCECRLLYALIHDRIAEILGGYTVSDLLDPKWAQVVREQLTDLPIPTAHGSDAEAAHRLPEGRNHGAG
jgi:Rrf2 family protein